MYFNLCAIILSTKLYNCKCYKKCKWTENSREILIPLLNYFISVPSQAPSNFTVAAKTSTSITASWQLPPEYARHGTITGFKLFYSKKGSQGSPKVLTNNVTSLSRVVSALDEYTDYEFRVLAFNSKGDGLKSSAVIERTKEDGKIYKTMVLLTVARLNLSSSFYMFTWRWGK